MKRTCFLWNRAGPLAQMMGLLLGLSACAPLGAADSAEHELRPLMTRYARTVSKVTFTSEFKAYRDAELQEAENLDAITVGVDLVVPLGRRFQIRGNVPIYTTGTARLIQEPHENIDIHGYGGTLDFANVQLDWQFLSQEEHGFNAAVGGGVGGSLSELETTTDDIYNHHLGRVALAGVRIDKRISDGFTLLANAGLRYYWESDDLNPSGGSDQFAQADLFVAGVFNPFRNTVYPVIELAYSGDFGGYNSILAVPEIIWPLSRHFELKAGATFGLTSDGERIGARVQGVVRF